MDWVLSSVWIGAEIDGSIVVGNDNVDGWACPVMTGVNDRWCEYDEGCDWW